MTIFAHILKFVSYIYNFCFFRGGTFLNDFNFNIVPLIIVPKYLPYLLRLITNKC